MKYCFSNPSPFTPGAVLQTVAELWFRRAILPWPDRCSRTSFASDERAHRHQRIGRTTTFALWIVWLDQLDQAILGHDLIHLDQEAFTEGLFAFASVFGVSEGHLLHRDSTVQCLGLAYFTRFGSLFQSFLRSNRTLIRDSFCMVAEELLEKLVLYYGSNTKHSSNYLSI